jgi:putative endonuclease
VACGQETTENGVAMPYYVYILASRPHGTLYVGVTNDLIRRVHEHREDAVDGFTRRYEVKRLVHYESCEDVRVAIQREKNIKKWRRAWKVRLIEEQNPDWTVLYPSIIR